MDIKQRRDIETSIARALGWTEITDRFAQIGGSIVGKSPDSPRVFRPIPQYLVDYNAWSWVESYMMEEFTVEQKTIYASYIESVMSARGENRSEVLFKMINASLPVRGRAFLKAAGINLSEPTPEAA